MNGCCFRVCQCPVPGSEGACGGDLRTAGAPAFSEFLLRWGILSGPCFHLSGKAPNNHTIISRESFMSRSCSLHSELVQCASHDPLDIRLMCCGYWSLDLDTGICRNWLSGVRKWLNPEMKKPRKSSVLRGLADFCPELPGFGVNLLGLQPLAIINPLTVLYWFGLVDQL